MPHATTYTLRPATYRDAAVLARLSRDLIETGLPWRYTPVRMARLIAAPELAVVVALRDGRIAGFAVMQFGDEDAHLVLLCVQPAEQRRGCGRALLEWHLKSASVAGMGSVRLELRTDNESARAFYRRFDFLQTAIMAAYYEGRYSACRMDRRLRPATSQP